MSSVHRVACFGCAFLLVVALNGQSVGPSASTVFEAASVKPSPPSDRMVWSITGGPATRSPGRFTAANAPMRALLQEAYGLKPDQIVGPAALDSDRFDIVAKIPERATREQVAAMLRNLLVERFGLVAHTETRDLASYELVVAKGGLKMKEAEKAPPAEAANAPAGPAAPGPPRFSVGPDGAPVLPPGKPMWIQSGQRLVARMQTSAQIAQILQGLVRSPVVDKTGMTGEYDFTLFFAPDPARNLPPPPPPPGEAPPAPPAGFDSARDPVPDIFSAVQVQLGLRLNAVKTAGSVLVVDRVNRKPVEN